MRSLLRTPKLLVATSLIGAMLSPALGLVAPFGTRAGASMDPSVIGDIYSVIGTGGASVPPGNGIQASMTSIKGPAGEAVDASGNLYIADTSSNMVLELAASTHTQWGISMTAGDLYRIIGQSNGVAGDGVGGTAMMSTPLDAPSAVALDSLGDLYIANTAANDVMEISVATQNQWGHAMVANSAYIVAGVHGSAGSTGQLLRGPRGLALDRQGNLYIADSTNARVAEKPVSSGNQWGQSMTANGIVTIAGVVGAPSGPPGDGGPATSGSLATPTAVTLDASGNLYIADDAQVQEVPAQSGSQWGQSMTANDVYTVVGSATGSQGNSGIGGIGGSALLNKPDALAFSASDDLVLADSANNQIKILAGTAHSQWGQSMTQNDLYVLTGDPGASAGFVGDGGPAGSAKVSNPDGVAIDATGDVFVADAANHRVREVTATSVPSVAGLPGDIYAIAGIGTAGLNGTAQEATEIQLNHVHDGSFDASGDYYYSDTLNNRVQELATTSHTQWGIAMTAGDSYTIAGSPSGISGLSASGVDGASSLLNQPRGIWVDNSGNVYIADGSNNRVEELASTTGTQWGQVMTADHLYGVAGNWIGSSGHGGDGGAATSASLDNPYGVTIDANGNLYLALNGSNEVREVAAANGTQWGQSMTQNDIYRVMGSSSGASGSSADGVTSTSAKLWGADSVVVDAGGDVFVASTGDDQIDELVATTGTQWGQAVTANHVYSVAGTQLSAGFAGDQGPATSALLNGPVGIALDANGDLYIADTGNNRVRELAATTGSQWGQAMTSGDLYTVAGNGTGSTTIGLGGKATAAEIQSPTGVVVDGVGDLFIDNRADADEVISYNTLVAPGGPTNLQETSGGANLSELNSTQPSVPAADQTGTGMAVDAATGELNVNVVDDSISGRGVGLGLTRTYSSTNAANEGSVGYGWTDSYAMSIQPDPVLGSSVREVTQENGSQVTFIDNAEGAWVTASRVQASLSFDASSNTWKFTRAGRQIFSFDGSTGDLRSISDLNGETTTLTESAGQLSSVTDSSGRSFSVTWTADSPPLLSSVSDPAGRTMHYAYDASHELTSVVDVGGATTTYAYDAGHRLDSVTNAVGGTTTTTYDNAGRLSAQSDPMGRTSIWSVSLDSSGSGTVTTTDPLGVVSSEILTEGEVTSSTRAAGTSSATTTTSSFFPGAGSTKVVTTAAGTVQAEITTTTYGANGNVVGTVDPLGRTTSATFNTLGEPLSKTNPRGEITTFAYDARGNETSMSRPIPGAGTQVTSFVYGDSSHPGDVTSATDPRGNTWHYGYDADGHRISITDALGHLTTSSWNTLGERTSSTDANGHTASYSYDPYGNLTRSVDGNGATTSTTYDALGDKTSSTDADANVTTYAYDADHELTVTTLPDTSTNQSSYDGDGHEVTATDANGGVTTSTYTPLGHLAASTDPTGASTSYPYDANGNTISTTDPSGNTTTDGYDADNELTSVTVNGAVAQSTTYDADGNRTSVTDGGGQTTSYGFNALDQMTSETNPSGQVTSYTYDASSNKVTKTNPDLSVTTWTYDANNNVASTTSSSGASPTTSYTYTSSGQVASMTDGTGTSSYTYDTNGNLISSTDGAGATVTYAYDDNANLTCMSVPNPSNNGCTATGASGTGIITYDYSSTGSLTSLHDWAGRSFSYSYDANGNQTAVSIDGGAVTIAKHYDANGSITDQGSTPGIQVSAGGINLLSLSIARNADGTIASATPTIGSAPGPTDSFGYGTPAGQRSPVVTSGPIGAASGSTSYQYTSAGSITQSANQFASAAYSASGALCWTSSAAVASPSCDAPPSGATSYTYDANGERTSMTPSTGNPSAYGWNSAQGTLACVNTNGTTCSTTSPIATTTTYAYDGNGLRTTATTSTGTTHYTWDNGSSIPRLVSDGTWDYVYEPGSNVPIEQISTTGSTPTADLLITDANSAVKGLVQLSAGAQQDKLVNYVDYDAYGDPITGAGGAPAPGGLRVPQMGIAATTAFGFGGGYTDPTGLIYLVHRYYDPATGQFLSVDPLLNEIQQPHVYASDDPVNSTDLGGEIVNGYCLSGSAFGVIGGTAIWCSLYDNHGGSRVTRTVEAGVGWGAGVSYGFFYSSVVRIRDLMGASWCFGGGYIGALEVCLISTRYGTQYSVFFGFAGAELQASTTIGYTSDTTAFERWVLARMGISGR